MNKEVILGYITKREQVEQFRRAGFSLKEMKDFNRETRRLKENMPSYPLIADFLIAQTLNLWLREKVIKNEFAFGVLGAITQRI